MRISSFYFLVFIFGFLSCSNNIKPNRNYKNDLLRYFIQVDESDFMVHTSFQISGVEKITLNHFDDFKVDSVTSNNIGSIIRISRKSKTRFQSLKISFYDEKNIVRNIQIKFYSKMYNLHELELGQKIEFDRTTNIAPPLFVMTSLQLGQFIICKDNHVVGDFELLQDLYNFSLFAKPSKYDVGEKTCDNTYFSLIVK
ncbi:hypothetical protein GZ212_07280 [Mangrovimonas sp. CR14]|uniref:hypothetical protein n=1 Tax=Mangrovimonas sp. CR14 TaxID=2706120 RepID=UPI001420FC2E|nr:hypothetical protein [Mangrovimonas sp. CR14]NIK91951.1 hypothetical protein [Mangrovimonas sp. CR14]